MKASILEPIYEKKRKLEQEVGELAVSRDTSERKAKEAAEAVTDLNDTKSKLERLVETVLEVAQKALGVLTDIVTQGSNAVNTANGAIDLAQAVLTGLKAKIEAEEAVLEGILATQKTRLEEIAVENEKLGLRERDLDIYKARLQARYDELGLGKINLT